jgi:peptidoglycan hydrolase CwlO-like protein
MRLLKSTLISIVCLALFSCDNQTSSGRVNIESKIYSLEQRIYYLESSISDLESKVEELENRIEELEDYLAYIN